MAYTVVPTVNTGDLITASWLNTYVKDNLAYLLNPNKFQMRGTYSYALTTPYSSWVATAFSQTITMNGGPLLVGISGMFYMSAAVTAKLAMNVGGTRYQFIDWANTIADYRGRLQYVGLFSPAAGSVTVTLEYYIPSSTLNIVGTTDFPMDFWGVEI